MHIYSLTCEQYACSILKRKDRGGLIKPSDDVVQVCLATENAIVKCCLVQVAVFYKHIASVISHKVLEETTAKSVFDGLYEHMFDTNHIYWLINTLSSCYVKIRIHHLAKEFTAQMAGPKRKNSLLKLVSLSIRDLTKRFSSSGKHHQSCRYKNIIANSGKYCM